MCCESLLETVSEKSATAELLAPTARRRTMKYICLGYYDKGKHEGMTEDEQHAMFDECFEYDGHLRANGHFGAGEALQPPETALTLYWKNGKVATTDGPYAETKGTARRLVRARGTGHESCDSAHVAASGLEVCVVIRDTSSCRYE